MSGSKSSRMESANKIIDVTDNIVKRCVITTDRSDVMGIARSGRAHDILMFRQNALSLFTGLGRDVGTYEFQRVESRSVFANDALKILIPTKRMRGHNRGITTSDDSEQLGQSDTGSDIGQIGEAVNEEMPFPRRNLNTREKNQAVKIFRPLGQLFRKPLHVVFGHDHAVQPDRPCPID